MSDLTRSRLQVVGAALLFSTGGAAIKACALPAAEVAALRSGLAALVLVLALPGGRGWLRPRTLAVGLAYGATMVLFVAANKLTTAANTIFLQSTAPLYLLLLGPWLLAERPSRSDLTLAATLGLGMALFFVGSEPPQRTAPDPGLGNLLGVAAGVSWALTLVGLRWLARSADETPGDSPAGAVVAGNVLACLLTLPWAWPLSRPTLADGSIVVFLGVFQIGLAYVWLTRGFIRLPAFEVSLILLVEPVCNTIWTWLLHGERPGPWSVTGCTVILLATLARVMLRRVGPEVTTRR